MRGGAVARRRANTGQPDFTVSRKTPGSRPILLGYAGAFGLDCVDFIRARTQHDEKADHLRSIEIRGSDRLGEREIGDRKAECSPSPHRSRITIVLNDARIEAAGGIVSGTIDGNANSSPSVLRIFSQSLKISPVVANRTKRKKDLDLKSLYFRFAYAAR